MTETPSLDKTPNFWQRLSDTLLVRRADQTIVAMLVLAAIVGIGIWWLRHGGASGRLVDHDHLPTHHARFEVNVNTADHAELSELPNVGDILADRIIAYRGEHGPFKSFEDLKQVKGIGTKTLELLKPQVTFGDATK